MYETPTERNENYLHLPYIKLFFSLFVLEMVTLKFTSHELIKKKRQLDSTKTVNIFLMLFFQILLSLLD